MHTIARADRIAGILKLVDVLKAQPQLHIPHVDAITAEYGEPVLALLDAMTDRKHGLITEQQVVVHGYLAGLEMVVRVQGHNLASYETTNAYTTRCEHEVRVWTIPDELRRRLAASQFLAPLPEHSESAS